MADGETTVSKMNRRAFLQAGAAVGGGLLVGFQVDPALAQTARAAYFAPNAWVRVGRDGFVTLMLPKSEMGQGILTTLAMLTAEELEVDLDQVRVEIPPADKRFAMGPFGQGTGGSTSVRQTWEPMRQAAATARAMIVEAAAKQWNVAADSCRAEKCQVIHVSSGRRIDYGRLVDVAATLPAPASAPVKQAKDYRLIGRPRRRLEAAGKVDGSAKFGLDVKLPNMKVATIAASPVFGGKLRAVDDTEAMKVPGVRQVVKLDNAVAVVGDHMWAAKQGLAKLKIDWDEGAGATVNQADLVAAITGAAARPGAVARKEGDAAQAMAGAARRVEAAYQTPFLAHAPMEPMNCTARVDADGAELWVGSQGPDAEQAAVAQALKLPLEKVKVNNFLMGGGFGRKGEGDVAVQAALVAKAAGVPVKLVWTREEDIQHDFYHPLYADRIAAGLDAEGKPVAWTHRVAGGSVFARRFGGLKDGLDVGAVDGAADLPYAIPNLQVEYGRADTIVPVGFWRGVGPTHNIFVVESFVDELAHAAGKDPVEYRRMLLKDPRVRGVLDLAVEKAGWGSPLPPGHGRGVSAFAGFGSYIGTVAEVSVDNGKVRVHKVVCAVDCGVAINPQNIAAQMEGGVNYGLTAALRGEITIEGGRVKQANFNNYLPLRIDEAPVVETYLVASQESPGGIGEPGTAGIAPAVTNAIFAATGKRIRELPISRFDWSQA